MINNKIYIDNIFINSNYVCFELTEKSSYSFFKLEGNSNEFSLDINDGKIDLKALVEENFNKILKEEEYTLIYVDKDGKNEVFVRGNYKGKFHICKKHIITINNINVSVDVIAVNGLLKIHINAINEKNILGKIQNVELLRNVLNIKIDFIESNNEGIELSYNDIKNRKLYIEAINNNQLPIEIKDVVYNNNNSVDIKINTADFSNREDGIFLIKCYMDCFKIRLLNKEKITFKKVIDDENGDFKKSLIFELKKDLIEIKVSSLIKANPKINEVDYKDDIIINGDINSNIDISKYNNISSDIKFTSRDKKQEFHKEVLINRDNTFVSHITAEDINNLNNLYHKEWDIKLVLYMNDDVILEKEIYYKDKNAIGILKKERIKFKEYTIHNEIYLTKDKKRVALKFNNPITITKVVSIEIRSSKIKFKLRFNKNIEKLYNKLNFELEYEEDKLKSSNLELKGKKTLVVEFISNNMEDTVSKIVKNGLKLNYTLSGETFRKEISDVDKDIIVRNFREKLFRTNKYKMLCSKLYNKLFLKMPIKKQKVLFESFLGRNVSGNPKYIYEYMVNQELDKEYELIWILNNLDEEISGKGKKVKRKSIMYYYHMATAKYWIFNTRQADEIIKRKENVYLQTWHGTPLKRLAMDMDSVNMAGQTDINDYKDKFYNNSRRWDYLLSQNDYSTEIFKRAFAFEKPILDYGYPANDILYNSSKQDIEEIKKKFNIPLDKKVILYAPTWRDNNFMKKGYYKMQMQLELDKMQKELGDEYVVLLRMHYLIMNAINIEEYKGFVYDFSQGYDIQELYLVSDMLITDYSSVMFDYSNLNRPIIFFAYDIEDYRDSLRGFYFNFGAEASGPIVKTTEEVISSIKDIDKVNKEYKEKKKAFYDKFCHIDNGHAAEKVVNKLFNNGK